MSMGKSLYVYMCPHLRVRTCDMYEVLSGDRISIVYLYCGFGSHKCDRNTRVREDERESFPRLDSVDMGHIVRQDPVRQEKETS